MAKKTPLRKAVEFLKENGKIKSQKELLPVFEQNNEGNLTKILNSINPNDELVKKFEKAYGIKVSEFEKEYTEYDLGEAVKKIEAISEVTLSAMAELLAKANNSTTTSVYSQLQEAVRRKLS